MENDSKEIPLTREEKQIKKLEHHLQTIAEIRQIECDEIVGYFYRETTGQKPEACGMTEEVLTDDEVGRRFGPGRYKAIYRLIASEAGEKDSYKVIRYRIAREYAKLHREYCEETGEQYFGHDQRGAQPQGDGILGLLTSGRAQELIGIAAGVKALFSAPPPPPPQSMSDAVMVAMINNMNKSAPAAADPVATMGAQLDLFAKLRDVTAPQLPPPPPPEKEDKEMSFMEKTIEMGLQFLPEILNKNNGDIAKAAAAAKLESKKLRALLLVPSVHKPAYQALVKQYGQSAADQWARGFGLDPVKLRGEVVHNPATKTNEVIFG